MALRRQSLSPAAALLRNSRLFSLPNPLPRPQLGDSFGGGIIKASDTATLPYPTHQAIITTPSSLARGDWGLKRPLPNKSSLLQVSDPVLRISQLDTIEHVTDYDSAADHVRTREKWEEMSVPMMKGLSVIMRDIDLSGTDPFGAFEPRDDTTSYDTDLGLDEGGLLLKALKENCSENASNAKRATIKPKQANQALHTIYKAKSHKPWKEDGKLINKVRKAGKLLNEYKEQDSLPFSPFIKPPLNSVARNTRRWKYDGPWLPGMSADEFLVYLDKEVSKRRPEFTRYLVQWVKSDIYKSRQQAAIKSSQTPLDSQEAAEWQKAQEKAWSTFTKKDIDIAIHSLRREAINNILSSKLVEKLIFPFLKLPTVKFKSKIYSEDANKRDYDQFRISDENTPLSTHPSAGLGYLRTKSYLSTHPILGPQAHPTPISARVIQPRGTSTGTENHARFGVGGFVANDDLRGTDRNSAARANISNAQDVETIDIDTVGGKKVLVHPMFASVTNNGRVMIKLKRAVGQEGMVAKGLLDDRPEFDEELEAKEGTGGEGEDSDMAQALNRVLAAQGGGQAHAPQQQ